MSLLPRWHPPLSFGLISISCSYFILHTPSMGLFVGAITCRHPLWTQPKQETLIYERRSYVLGDANDGVHRVLVHTWLTHLTTWSCLITLLTTQTLSQAHLIFTQDLMKNRQWNIHLSIYASFMFYIKLEHEKEPICSIIQSIGRCFKYLL